LGIAHRTCPTVSNLLYGKSFFQSFHPFYYLNLLVAHFTPDPKLEKRIHREKELQR